jgi:hypothetical protein
VRVKKEKNIFEIYIGAICQLLRCCSIATCAKIQAWRALQRVTAGVEIASNFRNAVFQIVSAFR